MATGIRGIPTLAASLLALGAVLAIGCDPAKSPRARNPPVSAPGPGAPPASTATTPAAVPSAARPSLEDLQGAWWSDSGNPTADFGIMEDQVWLDPEAGLNPCRIVGDTLVFDLDGGGRQVRNRIVRLSGDTLVLENAETRARWVVVRAGR